MHALRPQLIAIWLVLGGCVCNDNICTPTGVTPERVQFATAGAPVTVTLLLPISCGTRTASSTTVSVLDPTSSTVTATTADPRIISGQGFGVDVTFTPAVPGSHHIAARFEPNFGITQLDVFVAAEMRDAGSVVVAQPCARGDFSPGGLILCTNSPTLDVLDADGGFIQAFTAPIIARRGGTLWVSDGGTTVERWVEDGGRYELVASAQAPAPHRTIIPGADDDALFIGSTGGTLQLWVDGGIVTVNGPMIPSNDDVWRSAGELALVNATSWCVSKVPGFVADGGTHCTTETMPTIVGLGPDGIWVNNEISVPPANEALVFDNLTPNGFALPGGWRASSLSTVVWDTSPLIGKDGGSGTRPDAGPFVLRKSQGNVIVENYGGSIRSITSSCVTVPVGSASRLIRR